MLYGTIVSIDKQTKSGLVRSTEGKLYAFNKSFKTFISMMYKGADVSFELVENKEGHEVAIDLDVA